MFRKIRDRINEIKKSKEFNAENCKRKQQLNENKLFNDKVEEIEARINYVVTTTTTEHTVIYKIHETQKKLFYDVETYFQNLGFRTIRVTIPQLENEEFLIISWK